MCTGDIDFWLMNVTENFFVAEICLTSGETSTTNWNGGTCLSLLAKVVQFILDGSTESLFALNL